MKSSVKINSKDTQVSGASLKGWVRATYEDLTNKLGSGKQGSADGKTTVEWVLEDSDGTVALIYDWKSSSTPKDFYEWHIGGHTSKALELIETTIGIKPKRFEIV